MIKVSYNDHDYVFVPKRSCWVSSTNMVVKSAKKVETLRQIAVDLGHTEKDFQAPPSEMERYMKMLEQAEKTIETTEKTEAIEKPSIKVKPATPKKEGTKVKKKKGVKIKKPGAVSLKGFFNKE